MLLALFKPYGVLSQFTPEPGSRWGTLAGFGLPPSVYPLGRLDADSEGLLILGDEPAEVGRILDPARGHPRTYWAQVEGIPSPEALDELARGVTIKGGYRTRASHVRALDPAPALPARQPPVRFRMTVPDRWLEIVLTEGKNRQVRRMTAAVGHPTLRLVRTAIGRLTLAQTGLAPGQWTELDAEGRADLQSTPLHP